MGRLSVDQVPRTQVGTTDSGDPSQALSGCAVDLAALRWAGGSYELMLPVEMLNGSTAHGPHSTE
jgi:hypothetical protein